MMDSRTPIVIHFKDLLSIDCWGTYSELKTIKFMTNAIATSEKVRFKRIKITFGRIIMTR